MFLDCCNYFENCMYKYVLIVDKYSSVCCALWGIHVPVKILSALLKDTSTFLITILLFFITDPPWNVGGMTQRTESRAKHTCEVCSKPCPSAAHLRMHVRVHTGEKPFVCSDCGKGFAQKGSLKAHIIGRHLKSLQWIQP